MSNTPLPTRVRLSRAKGWRMPPNTIKVDRSTPWGNPFVTGLHATQAECVDLFEKLCAGLVCLTRGPALDVQDAYLAFAAANRAALVGKNLACWCALDKPCHADVLLRVAAEFAKRETT